jgi:citrate lyase beta subunit
MSKTVLHDGDEGVLLIVKDVKPKRAKAAKINAPTRSPVHVVYGGAHLFKADTPQKLGGIALKSLETYAPNFVEFADAMWLKGCEMLPQSAKGVADLEKQLRKNSSKIKADNYAAWFAWTIYQRTFEKLKNEPVEDFRIDFEDGYGFRTDAEEDADAIASALKLAEAYKSNSITHFSGFRIKSYAAETRERAVRTLKLFFDTLLQATRKNLPGNFVVTLPKVSDKKEVADLCKHLKKIEKDHGLPVGSIKIEVMIEHPLAIVDKKGNIALLSIIDAARGRCTSAHFGAFDYTASLGIAASHQHLRHDACNFARQMMLIALSPIGIRLSDSVTTQMPVPIHKGAKLSNAQMSENKKSVISGWRTHFNNVTHSMIDGFYQSWDLHPNQLVARYAAVYAFFLEAVDEQASRLKAFVEKATQANLTANTFDDAATAQGLINFFLRGIDCGALTESEVAGATSLSIDELRSSSFSFIIEGRRRMGS